MGDESLSDVESSGSIRRYARRSGGWKAAALVAASLAVWSAARSLAEETTPEFPSKIILGVRSTCMDACQEKEGRASCARYCDCHLFELRRDISDRQLEQLLLTAERGGENADAVRQWLMRSAKLCEKRVFGDKPTPAGEAGEKPGAGGDS